MPVALGTIASHRTVTAVAPIPTTGLVGWWDADDASTFTFSSGNSVSQWNDKSGAANHATWVNSSWPATRVAAAINGKAAMDFHPGSLNTALVQPPPPFTIIAAVKTGAITGNLQLIGANFGHAGSGGVSWDALSGYMRLLKASVALVGQATSPHTAATPAVLGVAYGADNVWAHHRDGAAVGTGTTAVTFTAGINMCLGGSGAPNAGNYDGLFGEFLIYNRVLSTVERQQVESYLTAKWLPTATYSDVLLEPFNDFTTNGWTSAGAPSIETGRTGTAADCTGATDRVRYSIATPAQSSTLTVGFAYRVTSIAANRHPLALLSDTAATYHIHLRVTTTGAVAIVRGTVAGTVIGTSAATALVPINTWVYLELQATLGDSPNGSVIVRVNGTERLNLAAVDTRNAGTKTVFDAIDLPGPGSGTTALYDDLYVTSGAGAPFKGDITIP